jgi:glycosyltransferase involved in cell wall biosynthesis
VSFTGQNTAHEVNVSDKKTILVLSDHPLSPSGVGIQTKYMIEAMLKTGKYRFFCLGGAIKHQNYNLVRTEEWGDDFVIQPVDGYGTPDMLRSIIRNEKPSMVWFMTDPRFWGWLWQMEDEVRSLVPMVYYHVWDNHPAPIYNKPWYDSTDVIACISKVTEEVVKEVVPNHKDVYYLPHTVDTEVFKKIEDEKEIKERRKEGFKTLDNVDDRVIFFWNNRNARRKQSGSLIYWFKTFLDEVGHDKATLLMHTDPKDVHGQDLEYIIHHLGLDEGQVFLSRQKVDPEHLAVMYNIADCTISVSDAEGFGLATLESLACETPIIVTMTGGLQEQVTDGERWFGIGMEPTSRAIIGSQEIPFIYEDRLSEEVVVDALKKIYNATKEERAELGNAGREHVLKNYSPEKYAKGWEELFDRVVEQHGSWDTRKGYKAWELIEV